MNGWNALQAYDLVNDGRGNYQFQQNKDYSAAKIRWSFIKDLIECTQLGNAAKKQSKGKQYDLTYY